MNVTIIPSKAKGTIYAPPSKSVAHRALICGALTEGCTIKNCGLSKDIEATLRCLSAMGAKIEEKEDSIIIGGLSPFTINNHPILDCGESGSTLRFLLPLCLLSGNPITLTGQGKLMQRPMEIYESLCRENDFTYVKNEDSITVCGQLRPGHYAIPGDVSSQFITGLIFALSLLQEESILEVTGRFESASYVDITLAVLSDFGVAISREHNTYFVKNNQSFSNKNYVVEGDCSNAAFLDAFNLLSGDVKVLGLSPKTPQGDWAYKQMYADLQEGKQQFDLSDCPDLGPVMFALSAAFGGAQFIGTARLRIKESDRCQCMADELAKFGISTEIGENYVNVLPGELTAPSEILCGHNDHRIVMALSLLCTVVGGTIDGTEAIAKSYPHFFEDIKALGIELNSL